MIYVLVSLGLMSIAALASYVPARHATLIDPVRTRAASNGLSFAYFFNIEAPRVGVLLAPNAHVEIAFNPQPDPPARIPGFRIR